MNWLVAIGAMVVGTVAFIVRTPAPADPAVQVARVELPAAERIPGPRTNLPVKLPDSPIAAPATERVETQAVAPVAAAPEEKDDDSGEARERALLLLEQALALSPGQRILVEQIWRERDAEVAVYHAEIRAAKVLWVWGHDRKAREILAASQARVAAALYPEQSRRYVELLESGKLAEGVSFEVTPEITVIR